MKLLLIFLIFITVLSYARTQLSIGYSFSIKESKNTIKKCVQTCRKVLIRGDRDLNYCIEGCRIKAYKRIYDCVYEQCNDRGNGIPFKYTPEQYHQCVYLCKVRPKLRTRNTSTTTESTERVHFIPVEYHFKDPHSKAKEEINSENSLRV